MLISRRNTRISGDTLIEVLFAVAIFSLVAVGGLSIMNQGLSTAQRSLEITLVRQEINSQAETLRFLNASYIAAYRPGTTIADYPDTTPAGQWAIMLLLIPTTGVSNFGLTSTGACPSLADHPGSFILNTHSAKFVSLSASNFEKAETFAKVNYNIAGNVSLVDGVWIEAIRSIMPINSNQDNADYIDFHIRACWDSPGQSVPVTLGTIVRLYEPRG